MTTRLSARARSALVQAKRLAEARPTITGVDWGPLYKEGRRRGRGYGVRFHVRAKLPLDEIPPSQILPSELWGYPCDVQQVRFGLQADGPTDEITPLRSGISVGNFERDYSGTLGGIVRDRKSGKRGVLSNWHVLCGNHTAEHGDTIIQPGPQHLNTKAPRPIGKLCRWLDLGEGLDAAYAELDPNLPVDWIPIFLNEPIAGVAAPAIGMHVRKVGAKTHLTHAIIDGVEGAYRLSYIRHGDAQDRFMDGLLLKIDPKKPADNLSLGGDSGALWIDVNTNMAVALHFAGEHDQGPLAEKAIAHPLPRVLDQLGVDLLTSD